MEWRAVTVNYQILLIIPQDRSLPTSESEQQRESEEVRRVNVGRILEISIRPAKFSRLIIARIS